jgi:hypothetical protein
MYVLRSILTLAFLLVSVGPAAASAANGLTETAMLVDRVAKLEEKLADVSDRLQIHDVYVRYMRGFDRSDVELMRTAFWPDVQINYGRQSNTFDEFIERHLKLHTTQLATWGHLLTNESVEIHGDIAHVETYVTALWVPKDERSFAYGKPIVSGRYIDRLDRRNGEWRITVREFVPHFALSATANPAAWDQYSEGASSSCTMGTWDKHDPSYVRPLERRLNKGLGPPCGLSAK